LYQHQMIDDGDCGMKVNEDWQGKPKYSEKTCPSATLSTTNPAWPDPSSNVGRCGGKPATNRLSYGAVEMFTAFKVDFTNLRALLWRSRSSVVGITTGYELDDRGVGVRAPVRSIFSSPRRPDRLWGPPSLLFNGYRGLFP
jgi:hypothetical protein